MYPVALMEREWVFVRVLALIFVFNLYFAQKSIGSVKT
jgi:hypothetical protein